MTTINLENGGTIGVYGDVNVRPNDSKSWYIDILGEIAKVDPPHTMEKLRQTRAVSINPDDLPGNTMLITREGTLTKQEYIQIPKGIKTIWLLPEEAAELT